MKRGLMGAAVFAAVAAGAGAGEIVVGFDDIATDGSFTTPVPADYLGWTWSGDVNGGGRGYVDQLDVINSNYGGTLDTISGPNIFYNGFGDDDVWVQLDGDYFLESAYFTTWPGFGPPDVRVIGMNDGAVVYDSSFAIADNEWTLADFGGVMVDEVHIQRDLQAWWLMDNLTFSTVPAPGALALLGLGLVTGSRRRRA